VDNIMDSNPDGGKSGFPHEYLYNIPAITSGYNWLPSLCKKVPGS
jgi:hypothetical protein